MYVQAGGLGEGCQGVIDLSGKQSCGLQQSSRERTEVHVGYICELVLWCFKGAAPTPHAHPARSPLPTLPLAQR